MAATAESISISELKAEIERLSRELDQASSEKIQSAQLGLVLLEEKSSLQLRCDELESLYENTKHELDITQEALMKLDSTQKVTTQSGIDQENALLNESAAMESSLTLQIIELEGETKQLRHELERVISERDRLLAESSELGADKATRESERAALRAELREARQREQRLLQDIGDLEDENISLQKQVSALRSSQVEFEGLKHEVRQLREEAENARAAADETAALRRIAERQLAEALEALQAEREAKFAAKKELDAHLSREAQFNITNLAYSIRGMPEEGTESEGEAGASGAGELGAEHHADLFSEVHLHEISRLEKQLEQAHSENAQLAASLRLAQSAAEGEGAAAGALRAGVTRVCSRVAALHALHADCGPADERAEGVSARAAKWLTWWRVSGGELAALLAALRELDAPPDGSPAALQRAQLAQLSDRAADAELRCAALQADAETLRALAGAGGRVPPRVRRERHATRAAAAGARGRGGRRRGARRRGGAGAGGGRAGGAARGGAGGALRRHAAGPAHAPARRARHRARLAPPAPASDGGGGARAGAGRAAGAGDQAEVAAVHQARADRHAAHRAQVQQEHGGGGARQPQVQVRDGEDHRHRDHAQAAQRAAPAQGRRRHLLQSARHVRGALRGVRDAGGRADAGAVQRGGGEAHAQPAAAPRRAAEAVAHAAPRGAGGGPRDAHAARAQAERRHARARTGFLAARARAQGGRRRPARAAAPPRARAARAARALSALRIYAWTTAAVTPGCSALP